MIRSFIAIDLPSGVQRALEELAAELKKSDAPVGWVRPEAIHLTLKFLGSVPEEMVASISSTLEQIARSVSPFQLQPCGCGAFPSIKQARVVWVGLQGDNGQLAELQKMVETAMVPFGFQPEGRPFRGHLTLGRVKGRQRLQALQQILLARQGFITEPFDVAELVLYKSELRPEGARYTPLFRAPFAGRPD